MVTNELIIEFASIYLGIVTLQPSQFFLSRIYIYSPESTEEIIFFGIVELSTMFAMTEKAKFMNSFIFMNVFLRTFMSFSSR